jgi:AAA+ ATPase superfamily predicted ATPase
MGNEVLLKTILIRFDSHLLLPELLRSGKRSILNRILFKLRNINVLLKQAFFDKKHFGARRALLVEDTAFSNGLLPPHKVHLLES